MDKPKDIIIRFSVYGFLIGIIFPFLSLLIFRIDGNLSFSLRGFIILHSMFPEQYLIDSIVILSTLAGLSYGYSISVRQTRLRNRETEISQSSGKILEFLKKLINKEFSAELELEKGFDPLGESLIKLRNNLSQDTGEQKQRKMEDDQRNWVSEGLANFGDILRISFDKMEDFAFSIISYAVKYLRANQGGFFLVEQSDEGERYFDLKASYAYDRRKFADKQVDWGEGIIGTCALEMQSIYMTEIPKGYLEITSGLGYSPPGYLLIVPMIVQSEVIGILEIASFNPIREFEIGFVESLAESTANTISNLRSNIRTSELLRESQTQAETLALQEEKMRQSMEQLKNTQEQAAKQAEKFISFTNSVNHTLIRAEYNTDGILEYANTKFLHKLGYFSNAEVEGQHISIFLDPKDREWFDPIWKRFSTGGKHYEGYMKHVTKTGQDLWTMATYTCVRKDDGAVDKVLFLAIDTTEQRKQSLDFEGQIESINRLNIKIEFAPDGKYLACNGLFLDTLKYTEKDLEKMSVFDFIEKNELEGFNDIWQDVIKGKPYSGQFRSKTKFDDEKWFRISFTSVHDMYGEVAKVICLATDITNEKLIELESKKQSEQLKVQEDKLKLAGVELKKKLEKGRSELEQQYTMITREKDRLESAILNDPNAIFMMDQSSKILFMNMQAEQFFGVKSTSMHGKECRLLFKTDFPELDSFIQSLLDPKAAKITGEKKRIKIPDGNGTLTMVEMYLTRADLKNETSYMIFISSL